MTKSTADCSFDSNAQLIQTQTTQTIHAHGMNSIESSATTATKTSISSSIINQAMQQARQRKTRRSAGFTLIEIMMVIAIIGILAGLSIYTIGDTFTDVRGTQAKTHISQIETALNNYRTRPKNRGQYPTTEQGLDILAPNYVKRIPKDPWDEEYQYLSPGREGRDYDLWTYGKDKQAGGEGENADITSWDATTTQ